MLTPAETDALFRTLKLLVGQGLSIIFISHKLHEVMAVSDRVLVLRAGRLAGERVTARDQPQRTCGADGRAGGRRRRRSPPAEPGPAAARAQRRLDRAAQRAAPPLDRVSLTLARRRDHRPRRRLGQRPGGACRADRPAPSSRSPARSSFGGAAVRRLVAALRRLRRHRPHPGRPPRRRHDRRHERHRERDRRTLPQRRASAGCGFLDWARRARLRRGDHRATTT